MCYTHGSSRTGLLSEPIFSIVAATTSQGLSNREIAQRLVITEATVKTHTNNIFSKAGLRDRAQAVVYAIRHGVAEDP